MKVYCGSADAQPCTPFPQFISYEYISYTFYDEGVVADFIAIPRLM